MTRSVEDRFWAKVAAPRWDGCRLWTGGTTQGYGRLYVRQGVSMVYAHRFSYELHKGPVPVGHDVDHDCHNNDLSCPGGFCRHRRCVEPTHLLAATRQANLLASQHTLARHHRDGTDCGCSHNCRRFRLWEAS